MNKLRYILLIIITYSCGFIPEPHSVPLSYEQAEKLLTDLKTYGKIYEMDDCTRHYKFLNGHFIRMEKDPDSSKYIVVTDKNTVTGELYISGSYPAYYKDVLKELDIDSVKFNDFRERLEKTKLRTYESIDSFSIFVVDGFMDGILGYFHVTDTNMVPTDQFKLGDHMISFKERVEGNWYRFGGS